MGADRIQQVQELFEIAVELPPDKRRKFLDRQCGSDTALRTEVIRRVLAHGEETLHKEQPTPRPTRTKSDAAKTSFGLPKQIGRYRIKRVIGSGGMGTVYEALQEHPRRTVALKVMKHGITSPSLLRRFEYESQILARLRHPGIAQVYEADTYDDGSGAVPYFVMEFIPNAKPITEYAESKKLGIKERLVLFARVCDAVHHGHQKGIIHRDLKPGNIVVDSSDAPRIIDFGVARATDSDMAVTTFQTDIGQLIGTLQYMSPEQCEGHPLDLDIRSDVYAMGIVLYELLCGEPPYDISGLAIHEAVRVIREETPTKPSTLNRRLRGDIETIVLKALNKDREGRYRSAAELGDDINRYLSNEPIIARPPSLVYQLKVFARRNKLAFRAIALVVFVLAAATVFSTTFAIQAARAKRSEESQRVLATGQRDRAQRAEEIAQRRLAETEAANAALQAAQNQINDERWQLYVGSIAAASSALSMEDAATLRLKLDGAPPQLRNWEWRYLDAQTDPGLSVLGGHMDAVRAVAFSPDGTRLASGSADRTVRLWDAHTGDMLDVLYGHKKAVRSVTFSPDGTRLASSSDDWTIRVWEASTGQELVTLRGHEREVTCVAFNPDGTHIASGSVDDTVRLWDVSAGKEIATLRGHHNRINSVDFSPDGMTIASGSNDRTIKLWDVAAKRELTTLRGHDDAVLSVAFSPDGTVIASAAQDRTVRVWDALTGAELRVLEGHRYHISAVSFSPDGRRLASAGHSLRVWDVASGQQLLELQGPYRHYSSVSFSPDGARLASAGETVRLWDASTGTQNMVSRGHEGPIMHAAFDPTGTRLASASADRTVRIWDAATGEELAVLRGHQGSVSSVAYSPEGRILATASRDRTVRLWDATTGAPLNVLMGHEREVSWVTFSPDGGRLASASSDKTVRLWDASTGEERGALRGHTEMVFSVAFSPDGSLLASASEDKTVRVWDLSTREAIHVLEGHDKAVRSVAFSPSGSRLASAGEDNMIRIWDVATGQELWVMTGSTTAVWSVTFNPDGTRLVSSSLDGTVRVWDSSTAELLLVLRGHTGHVHSVAFSPDGTRLVSGWDKAVRLWDSERSDVRERQRRQVRVARAEAKPLVDDLFDRGFDPEQVATLLRSEESLDDTVRLEALKLVLRTAFQQREPLRAEAQSVTARLFSEIGVRDDVIEALKSDETLSDAVREAALDIARWYFVPWSPNQAAGAPDTEAAGDSETAWASQREDGGEEWLELDYDPPLVARQVRIHETFNPGAVVELVLRDADGREIARIPVTDTVDKAPVFLEVSFELTREPVKSVRVILDTKKVSGWNEIDAVELIGPDRRDWAAVARASSYWGEMYPGAAPEATFNEDVLKGEYSARVTVLRHDGMPAAGASYRLTFRGQGVVTVSQGELGDDGVVELAGLAGGEQAPEFILSAGRSDSSLGTITLDGDQKVRDFEFKLPPEVGDLAPDLNLVDALTRKTVRLAEFSGQVVFVDFWTTWCAPCQKPMAHNNDIMERRRSDWAGKAVILGLSIDSGLEKLQNHVRTREWLNVRHLWCGEGSSGFRSTAALTYGIDGIPSALLIDRDGRIVWRGHPASFDVEREIEELLDN